jgi:hypothetical protein
MPLIFSKYPDGKLNELQLKMKVIFILTQNASIEQVYFTSYKCSDVPLLSGDRPGE